MNPSIQAPVSVLTCVLASLLLLTSALAPTAGAAGPLHFQESFEVDSGWGIFEEIVGGNDVCYADGIGQVVRTADFAKFGTHSLLVWANQSGSVKNNHVIAQARLTRRGLSGTIQYELWALIDPGSANTTETGPEVSMQNTREISPGVFRTTTAGIQYVASPFGSHQWQIWTENPQNPSKAAWKVFHNQALAAGKWYHFVLVADYDANRYVSLKIEGNGLALQFDLSGYNIVQEDKFTEEVFDITLEGQNLWNNCDGQSVFSSKIYYDGVVLKQLSVPLVQGPNGHYYEIVLAHGIEWETANAAAEAATFGCLKGHLATITSAQEDAFLDELRVAHVAAQLWIGGFQPPAETNPTANWSWVNDEGPFPGVNGGGTYSNWYPGEPNDFFGPASEQYATIGLFHPYSGWNDAPANGDGLNGYIIEYEFPKGRTLKVDGAGGVDPVACPDPRDSQVYKTISKAIACAQSGDVISIAPAIYAESLVIEAHLFGLTIRSEDGSALDGSADVVIVPPQTSLTSGGGIVIRAHCVTLMGLKIVDATGGQNDTHVLVSVQGDNVSLVENSLVGRVDESLGTGSTADTAVLVTGFGSDDGVSRNVAIRSNEIERSGVGIRLERSADAMVHGNFIHDNLSRGIVLQEVPGTTVVGNTLVSNPVGIEAINTGAGTLFEGNLFEGNGVGILCAICGLLYNNGNSFIQNDIGIHIADSTPDGIRSVHGDLFQNNRIGLLCTTCGLMYNDGNTFSGNAVAVQVQGSTAAGTPTIHNDHLTGNGIGLKNLTDVIIDAQNNYWGCPTGPNSPGCDATLGPVDTRGALAMGSIDIRPASFPNPVNPNSKGRIPVAVLTGATFDAATINVATVRFGPTGTEGPPLHTAFEDVDFDGDLDLLLQFDSTATKLGCASRSAVLTGRTLSGKPFQGSDSVRPVGCP